MSLHVWAMKSLLCATQDCDIQQLARLFEAAQGASAPHGAAGAGTPNP